MSIVADAAQTGKTPGREESPGEYSAPNNGASQRLPMARIRPSGYNARKRFDPEDLDDLAASMHANGLLQPIVVRQIGEHYEIVAGERRFRAAVALEWNHIQATVIQAGDGKARELALVENLLRKDIDPIEEAEGYRQLQELGYTQQQIADKVNRSQPAVANAMRLLKLPEDVRRRIQAGELSVSHGIALLRFDGFPALISKIAEFTAQTGAAVSQIEKGIPWQQQLFDAGLVRFLNYSAKFDLKEAGCEACPFGAHYKSEYSNYCLNPAHYDELQAAVQARILEQARISQEKAAKSANAKVQKALNDAARAKDRSEGEPEAAPAAVVDIHKLNYNQYARIYDRPAGCTKDCPCCVLAKTYGDNMEEICLDPGRYNGLKAAETKARNKARKEKFAGVVERVTGVPLQVQQERLLAIMARIVVTGMGTDACRKAVTGKLLPENIAALFTKSSYEIKDGEFWQAVSEMDIYQLLSLLREILVRDALHKALEYRRDTIPLIDFLEGVAAPAEQADAGNTVEVETCARCGAVLPDDLGDVDGSYEDESNNGTIHDARGHIITTNGPCYCAACVAASVQICRWCGCTDEAGCDEGCSWVERDLCSACERRQAAGAKTEYAEALCEDCGCPKTECMCAEVAKRKARKVEVGDRMRTPKGYEVVVKTFNRDGGAVVGAITGAEYILNIDEMEACELVEREEATA